MGERRIAQKSQPGIKMFISNAPNARMSVPHAVIRVNAFLLI